MSPFSYANARIRVWKSDLIDNDFFTQLMETSDVDSAMALLSKTVYQPYIEKGVVKFEGASGVEEGLKLNLAATLQSLYRIGNNDENVQFLINLVLAKWDIFNLKTILRGVHSQSESSEIIEQLIPAGNLDEVSLQILAKQLGIKAVIDQVALLCHQYSPPLLKGYADYKQSNNLASIELELDKFHYNFILKQLTAESDGIQIIRQVTKREIDFTNIMTLLRLAREQLPDDFKIDQYFIPDGQQLAVEKLVELAKTKDIKGIVDALKSTPYHNALKQGFQRYTETGSLASIERTLENFNIKKNIGLFREDPLSVTVVMAFVWAKINEITNIRIILRGKQMQMPSKDIKEALVLV